jgi:hypothetical protein
MNKFIFIIYQTTSQFPPAHASISFLLSGASGSQATNYIPSQIEDIKESISFGSILSLFFSSLSSSNNYANDNYNELSY